MATARGVLETEESGEMLGGEEGDIHSSVECFGK